MESLIEEFGLGHIRKNRGDLLSGGERRRTEIARALATDPHFILLDEPFAGVDPVAVEDIQRIVAKLVTKNIGILISTYFSLIVFRVGNYYSAEINDFSISLNQLNIYPALVDTFICILCIFVATKLSKNTSLDNHSSKHL